VAVVLASSGCSSSADGVPGEQATSIALAPGSQQAWCAGQGTPVVLVSGIGDDASSLQWLTVEGGLSDRARVCRYDRPGTGRSPAPTQDGRGADELTDELDAVVRHAGRTAPVFVVAHSFGGYLARVYADRHPDRVAGLVLVDALDPSVGLLRGTGAATLDDVPMADEDLDLGDVEAAAARIDALPHDPPLTVLSRGRDTTAAWTAGQQRLAALSSRAEAAVVADAGHQIPAEAPEAVVAAVEEMLADG
jgi:pimeloyl-ACP methyl ester carboxylesterase